MQEIHSLNPPGVTGICVSNKCHPVETRYCGDIGFLLVLYRDIDRLRY